MSAIVKIVWDGVRLVIPEECGKPLPHQMQSTQLDNLIELSGRVCYDSVGSPNSRNTAEYHKHIQDTGHGCYDIETEVLTASGWKFWPDVEMDDRLATISLGSGAIEYHKPIRLVNYHHVGKMYRVDSRQVDLLVTPDHRMVACPTTTKIGRLRQDYSLIRCEELNTKSHAYMKNGNWQGGDWPKCLGRDILALLGFAIGDGSIRGKGSYTIHFHLRRERKISWLMSLIDRLKPSGFSMKANDANDSYSVIMPDNELIRSVFVGIYDDNREKVIPPTVLMGASRSGLEGLFEGMMQSDGHYGRTGDCYDTTSDKLVGQIQQLCLHIGLAANIGYSYSCRERYGYNTDKNHTRIHVIRSRLQPEVNRCLKFEGKSYWINDWEGDVFCAEVPNNTLYVRRNGLPVWSGNSVTEHAVFTFQLSDFVTRDHAGMIALALINRPGVYLRVSTYQETGYRVRITANARALIEWHKKTPKGIQLPAALIQADYLGKQMQMACKNQIPLAMNCCDRPNLDAYPLQMELVPPETDEEVSVSFYLGNMSRGCSHEHVRHRMSSFSQRSTRYCQESDSDWENHPLMLSDPELVQTAENVKDVACKAYVQIADKLTKTMKERGVDATTARKQARGAARGVLGNSLATEMIWSCNLATLKWYLHLRANVAADAEIRLMAVQMARLAMERWPDRFVGWSFAPSPDGIGEVVVEPKL